MRLWLHELKVSSLSEGLEISNPMLVSSIMQGSCDYNGGILIGIKVRKIYELAESSLFPPRFVINLVKKIECTVDLNINIKITLYKIERKNHYNQSP